MQNRSTLKKALIAGTVLATAAGAANAGGPDYSTILTGLVATAGVAAIVAAGAIKASPGFARWLTNKVATFFR